MSFLSNITRPTLDKPRVEGEIDLVSKIVSLLQAGGLSYANTWTSESEIAEAIDKNSDLQRFLISRNLSFRFHRVNVDSRVPRVCLQAAGPIEEYLENFEAIVVPALKAIDLPHL